MDLIYKDVLKVSYTQNGKKEETWLLSNVNEINNLSLFETVLINYIFKDVGENRKAVSLGEIKAFSKKKKNSEDIEYLIDNFEKEVNNEWTKKGYIETEKNQVPKIFMFLRIISIIMIFVGFGILNSNKISSANGIAIILLVGGLISFMINIITSRKKRMLNQEGENKLALWLGFKNFLEDFSNFEEKDMPEMVLWERYLVYASALGVAEKVLKKLKLRYPKLDDQEYLRNNMPFFYTMDIGRSYDLNAFSKINSGFYTAARDAQNIVKNIQSSRGGGGSFSSGGSSGGGGSGGSTGGGMD